MKKSLSILICLFYVSSYFNQSQIDNGGFENWENAGTSVDEPTEWSSIKTSDDPTLAGFAPVVWGQSSDAHSGNYSLEMTNVSVFGVVANGIVTNGRVHADFDPSLGYVFTDPNDSRWHQSFSDKPDSLVGWYKYSPNGGDKAKAEAILHSGNAQIPENGTFSNWIAQARADFNASTSSWTRFSVPFTYFNNSTPEYILLVLTSGDSTVAVNGSQLLLDDLELIYSSTSVNEVDLNIDSRFWENVLYVDFSNTVDPVVLQVFDLSGKNVYSNYITDFTRKEYHFDFPKGLYLVNFLSKSASKTMKIIMQ
ncbi:MAG: PCMD domain-containing protein [Bacteroidota bacterium]|nr:PCMD domain-containing protein [Bacteroidota bacterium]MEC8968427.1 PCMD domain-containing protein [Bacteroidota bacterium]